MNDPPVWVHEPESVEDITLEGERIQIEGIEGFDGLEEDFLEREIEKEIDEQHRAEITGSHRGLMRAGRGRGESSGRRRASNRCTTSIRPIASKSCATFRNPPFRTRSRTTTAPTRRRHRRGCNRAKPIAARRSKDARRRGSHRRRHRRRIHRQRSHRSREASRERRWRHAGVARRSPQPTNRSRSASTITTWPTNSPPPPANAGPALGLGHRRTAAGAGAHRAARASLPPAAGTRRDRRPRVARGLLASRHAAAAELEPRRVRTAPVGRQRIRAHGRRHDDGARQPEERRRLRAADAAAAAGTRGSLRRHRRAARFPAGRIPERPRAGHATAARRRVDRSGTRDRRRHDGSRRLPARRLPAR